MTITFGLRLFALVFVSTVTWFILEKISTFLYIICIIKENCFRNIFISTPNYFKLRTSLVRKNLILFISDWLATLQRCGYSYTEPMNLIPGPNSFHLELKYWKGSSYYELYILMTCLCIQTVKKLPRSI